MKKVMKRVLGVVGVGVALGMLLTGCGGDSNSPSSPTSPETLRLKNEESLTFNGVFQYEVSSEDIPVVGEVPELDPSDFPPGFDPSDFPEIFEHRWPIRDVKVLELKRDGSKISGISFFYHEYEDGSRKMTGERVNVVGVLESETRAVFEPVKSIPQEQEMVCTEFEGKEVCSDGTPEYLFMGGVVELSEDRKSFTLTKKLYGEVFQETYIRQ